VLYDMDVGADYCDNFNRCGPREGDCDYNSNCLPGLICHHDVGARYGVGPLVDVCGPPRGDNDFCRDMTCVAGDGNCANDNECSSAGPGAQCVRDIGSRFGFAPHVDVCLQNGHFAFCHAGDRCSSYEGDCDTNSDCRSGHYCSHNVGASYGFAGWVDVCLPYTRYNVRPR